MREKTSRRSCDGFADWVLGQIRSGEKQFRDHGRRLLRVSKTRMFASENRTVLWKPSASFPWNHILSQCFHTAIQIALLSILHLLQNYLPDFPAVTDAIKGIIAIVTVIEGVFGPSSYPRSWVTSCTNYHPQPYPPSTTFVLLCIHDHRILSRHPLLKHLLLECYVLVNVVY